MERASKIPAPQPSRGWSDLPEDFLRPILARIPPPHRFPFIQVCRSWRRLRRLFRPPPLMVDKHALTDLDEKAEADRGLHHYVFSFRLADDRRFRKLSRVFVFPNPTKSIPCEGNNDGTWLAEQAKNGPRTVHLVNPISGGQVDLPPIDPKLHVVCFCLSSPPTPASGSCTVVALSYEGKFRSNVVKLATCKVGDKQWATFKAKRAGSDGVGNLAFFNGELYLLYYLPWESFKVSVYGLEPNLTFRRSLRKTEMDFKGILMLPQTAQIDHSPMLLFVSRGELFALAEVSYICDLYDVLGEPDYDFDGECIEGEDYYDKKFVVLKLDGRNWVDVNSLGDRAILFGKDRVDCISASKEVLGMNVQRNRVYQYDSSSRLGVCSIKDDEGEKSVHIPKDGVARGWLTPHDWW